MKALGTVCCKDEDTRPAKFLKIVSQKAGSETITIECAVGYSLALSWAADTVVPYRLVATYLSPGRLQADLVEPERLKDGPSCRPPYSYP